MQEEASGRHGSMTLHTDQRLHLRDGFPPSSGAMTSHMPHQSSSGYELRARTPSSPDKSLSLNVSPAVFFVHVNVRSGFRKSQISKYEKFSC